MTDTDTRALVETRDIAFENRDGSDYRVEFKPYKDRVSVSIVRISKPQGRETVVGSAWVPLADALTAKDAELTALRAKLNTPELHDFATGVVAEAAHQRERWGTEHDIGKAPEDWFWLVGFLTGKVLHSVKGGDLDKAKHHTISTGAALANWHASLSGEDNTMQPGHAPSAALVEKAES